MKKGQYDDQIFECIGGLHSLYQKNLLEAKELQKLRFQLRSIADYRRPESAWNFAALGYLEAFQLKRDRSYKNFEAALTLEPGNIYIIQAYSQIAQSFGDLRKSVDIILTAKPHNTAVLSLLQNAIYCCMNALHVTLADELTKQLEAELKETGKSYDPAVHAMENARAFLSKIRHLGIDEATLISCAETAVAYIRDKYPIRKCYSFFRFDSKSLFIICVDAGPGEVVSATIALRSILREKFGVNVLEVIDFAFSEVFGHEYPKINSKEIFGEILNPGHF